MNRKLARNNVRLAWAICGAALVLFGLTFVVAALYIS
jgi:hypothetical protein